jgi:hypothetical protein
VKTFYAIKNEESGIIVSELMLTYEEEEYLKKAYKKLREIEI